MNGNEPAFPVYDGDPGMTLRQYFAACAMQAVIRTAYATNVTDGKAIAQDSLRIADALIAELNK